MILAPAAGLPRSAAIIKPITCSGPGVKGLDKGDINTAACPPHGHKGILFWKKQWKTGSKIYRQAKKKATFIS
jgi:hypothetical protein